MNVHVQLLDVDPLVLGDYIYTSSSSPDLENTLIFIVLGKITWLA